MKMRRLIFTLCAATFAIAATAQDKNEAIAAYNEGATAMQANKNAEAIASFERAASIAEEVGDEAADVRKNAENAVITLRKKTASALYSQRKYDEALKAMEAARKSAQKYRNEKEVTSINRALPNLYLAMGNEDMTKNLYNDAVQNYAKAVELNPNSSKFYLALGGAYQKLDSTEQALEAYDKTIEIGKRTNRHEEINDAQKQAKNLLLKNGQEAKDAENFKQAYEYFNGATKYDENDPDVRLQVAIVANRNNQFKDAIEAGEKGLELEKRPTKKPAFYYQVGYAYEQDGNTEKACANYKQIPAGDSDKANADGAIKRLKCE